MLSLQLIATLRHTFVGDSAGGNGNPRDTEKEERMRPRVPARSQWSLALVLAVLSVVLGPIMPAAAQNYGTSGGSSGSSGSSGGSTAATTGGSNVLLTVDSPINGMQVSNGQSVDVGGWSSGSMVYIYLDSANGPLLGSATVNKPRPDVVQVLGRTDLANSGFDTSWYVSGLSNGTHTLYVVATGNGQSTTQQVSINSNGPQYGSMFNNAYSFGFQSGCPNYMSGYGGGYGGYGYGGGYGGYGGMGCGPMPYTPQYNNGFYPYNYSMYGYPYTPYAGYPNLGSNYLSYPYNYGSLSGYGGIGGYGYGGYPYGYGGYGGIGYPGYYSGCLYTYYLGCSAQPAPTAVAANRTVPGMVVVTWTAAPNATSYTVTATPATVGAMSTSGTTVTFTTLTPGVTYTFSVIANGPLGTSTPATATAMA